ncbi:TetR/AcrR family transcriptional regulator [Actinoplanes sp. N902-109]|uniref:TetR/AcrR family transcriptional regulator n=1 Tax=Actinoplanes sp. (strain N902-109) TaxID=649831 RepID=UPI001E62703F|nr:TetR/AcrR family transcriptional regulator [Actinoplanes sp. N902-109]
MTTVSADSTGTGPGRKAPGRPRDARADDAILEAVIALLGSGQSADSISIESVAARAGVGKATIYRRWSNKEALLVDAAGRMKGPLPVPAGESVRDDLVMLVSYGRSKRSETYSRASACLMPEMVKNTHLHAVFQRIQEPRRNLIREVLRRGIGTGELRADIDVELTVLLLTAPTLAQNLLSYNPAVPFEGFPEKLVDAVLRGASAAQ